MKARDFSSIVVLSGAGISAESGLKTFRDNNGLWEGHRVEDVATPEAFHRNPTLVHEFYNLRRGQLLQSAQPNEAHKALGNFAKKFTGSFTLVTQNVDNLHEQGGSPNVIHMHGELLKIRCSACHSVFDCVGPTSTSDICVRCQQDACLRPNIVWFGEVPMEMDVIDSALSHCDLFVSIGTSGNVYPAAGFVRHARSMGAHCVELNLIESEGAWLFQEKIYGPATKIVPDFFEI